MGENTAHVLVLSEEISLKNVYITDYGIEYHASLKCPDLKRIIHVSRLSDVKGMRESVQNARGVDE